MDVASGALDFSSDRSRSQQDSQLRGSKEITQHLLKQRKEYEQNIYSYSGNDPLELRYNFITWIEKNYPNRGLDNGLITCLEETLSLLKDEPKYKQDTRYVALLIKYIELQPNALEMYQVVYNQHRGTKCAILYHAWANRCEKVKDFKLANEIYQLGINNKAEPFEELKEVHTQFQLNVGRRMLGVSDIAPNTPCREALKKLQINNQPAQIQGPKEDKSASTVEHQLPSKILSHFSDKENSSPVPKKLHPAEKVALASGGPRFKGRIRTDQPDTFKCPVVYFDADDPTKLVMYPKRKIYAVENQELQLEELIAKLYENEKKPRKFAEPGSFRFQEEQGEEDEDACQVIKKSEDGAWSQNKGLADKVDYCRVAYFEPEDPNKMAMYPKAKIYAIEGKEFQLEELKAMEYELKQNKSVQNASTSSTLENSVRLPIHGTPHSQASSEKVLHDSNVSLNNQSLTVATKEAFKLVSGMWNSPSPVAVKTLKALSEKLDSDTFKCPPPPPKSGFAVYTDESSFAGSLPSTSKQQNYPTKPLIPSDVENIPFVPKPSSILRNKLKEKDSGFAPIVHEDTEFNDVESDLGVRRLNSDDEEMNAVGYQKLPPLKKQSLVIYTDDSNTIETCVRKEIGLLNSVTPHKTTYIEGTCSTQRTTTITSAHKSTFIIACDDGVVNNNRCSNREQLVPAKECNDENQYPCRSNVDHKRKDDPLALPFIPPPVNDFPVLENEGKENADPENYNVRRFGRRELSGVLQPSLNVPVAPLQVPNQGKENDFANDTCNTKAFAFALPSSTPFTNQFRNIAQNSVGVNNDNTVTYCSYMAPEEVPKQSMPMNLSVILEASKERYSSSSGSSSSGQTPYGPSRLKTVNTCSVLKEESVNDLEKSLSRLQLEENIDPFCPALLKNLLSHVKFPQKHHTSGYLVMNHDAPIIRENCTLTLGKKKYLIEKELGKGSYARVLKATHKNNTVALKYQKPAFEWEYYIACEIRTRLGSSAMKNGFIEINQAYVFNNASILETEFGQYGSLINVANAVKLATGKPLKVAAATLLSIQLFSIVEHLHRCKIIHGDIKPDNFILHALPTSDYTKLCVKLIDFGRSIDMTLLPEETTFTTVVTTDGFQCNEMKENRPWTYQTDYYGLAGTAYCLLMGDYMKVIKRGGKWSLQTMLSRYLHRDVWQPIFQDLLNVESCTSLPDLTIMQANLEKLLNSMGRLAFEQVNSVAKVIQGHYN